MITWILAALLIMFCAVRFYRRPKGFPPGPRGVPFLGYAPFMSRELREQQFVQMSVQYGSPVVGLYLGSLPTILINGYHAVKECLTHDLLNARPLIGANFGSTKAERMGIIFSDGDLWKEQRRFTLWHLRDFGFGRGQMEELIHTEATELLEVMERKSSEGPMVATDLFGVPIVNVLWTMMAGNRYQYGDVELIKLLKRVEFLFRLGNPSGGIFAALPFLRKVFPKLSKQEVQLENRAALENFIMDTIKQHKETFDPNFMRDFMDTFIKEMRDDVEGKTSFTETQLVALCMDMFLAGSETTSNYLAFSMLHLVHHPDVQKKVQLELDQVVGRSRLPSLKDRPDLPYTEATILEIFRMSSVAPFTVPHRPVTDAIIAGYTIPAGSLTFINLWSIHMDKDHWGDPEVFRPERFIQIGKFVKDDWVIPFGIGKRACAGETLARASSFLFLTALLQKFSFSVPKGHDLPDLVPLTGFTLAPKPFSIQVTLRG